MTWRFCRDEVERFQKGDTRGKRSCQKLVRIVSSYNSFPKTMHAGCPEEIFITSACRSLLRRTSTFPKTLSTLSGAKKPLFRSECLSVSSIAFYFFRQWLIGFFLNEFFLRIFDIIGKYWPWECAEVCKVHSGWCSSKKLMELL